MLLTAQRTFTLDDQRQFAALSGDVNPMHMDAAAARKTQAGAPAVHGINGLLWALDHLVRQEARPIRKITARFEKFITIGQPIELHIAPGEKSAKLELRTDGARNAAIVATYGAYSAASSAPTVVAEKLPGQPVVRTFAEAVAAQGAFEIAPTDAASAYPHLAAAIGVERTRALMALSSLVGMVSPGLHSIFSSLTVQLTERAPDAPPALSYQTVSSHDAFSLVSMEAQGPGMTAEVDAFMRPAPVQQPRLKDLQAVATPGAFAGVKALILGGSRGLGEITAKLLAAGGADVAVTYAAGRDDAEKLAAEFEEAGLALQIMPYDARSPVEPQLANLPFRPNQIYYFATSKIFRQKSGLYSPALLAEFNEIYSTAFLNVCQMFSAGEPVQVFYPSSIAIEERPRDVTEYAMAKAAAEILCDDIDKFMPGVRVLRRRLPRLATDQTATLTVVETVSATDVMHEIVSAMTDAQKDATAK